MLHSNHQHTSGVRENESPDSGKPLRKGQRQRCCMRAMKPKSQKYIPCQMANQEQTLSFGPNRQEQSIMMGYSRMSRLHMQLACCETYLKYAAITWRRDCCPWCRFVNTVSSLSNVFPTCTAFTKMPSDNFGQDTLWKPAISWQQRLMKDAIANWTRACSYHAQNTYQLKPDDWWL